MSTHKIGFLCRNKQNYLLIIMIIINYTLYLLFCKTFDVKKNSLPAPAVNVEKSTF